MCTYSMVVDDWWEKWHKQHPYPPPYQPMQPIQPPQTFTFGSWVSQADFDKLKAEVEEMKKQLAAALAQDKKDGLEGCERNKADKHDLLRKIAELVGVDLKDVLPKPPA
jgi:hypothetical protein